MSTDMVLLVSMQSARAGRHDFASDSQRVSGYVGACRWWCRLRRVRGWGGEAQAATTASSAVRHGREGRKSLGLFGKFEGGDEMEGWDGMEPDELSPQKLAGEQASRHASELIPSQSEWASCLWRNPVRPHARPSTSKV